MIKFYFIGIIFVISVVKLTIEVKKFNKRKEKYYDIFSRIKSGNLIDTQEYQNSDLSKKDKLILHMMNLENKYKNHGEKNDLARNSRHN